MNSKLGYWGSLFTSVITGQNCFSLSYLDLVKSLGIPFELVEDGFEITGEQNLSEFVLNVEMMLRKAELPTTGNLPTLKFKKASEDAVIPAKNRVTDAGYDLTLVKFLKKVGDVYFYDTCIQVVPPVGYHTEIVPRSSISKTDFSMANAVGVIDPSYCGNLIVALRYHGEDKEDPLELPCRMAQLLVRKTEYLHTQEVTEVVQTVRGEGGFGSSG